MDKKILFVIDSLHCAGAEKSLTTLLRMLDYKRISVDLLLFSYGGEFEALLPPEVNKLEPLVYTKFTENGLFTALRKSLGSENFRMLKSRITYSYRIRRKQHSNSEAAMHYWKSVSNVIEENQTRYDIAISYAQGVPTFYVAEKVQAKVKFAWVNTSLHLTAEERSFQHPFYDQYAKIIAVSHSARDIFLKNFPFYSGKTEIIYDICNPDFITEMAQIGKSYDDNFEGVRILTVGRLDHGKGYDIALEACIKLMEKGFRFRWYVLGKGPLQKEIEKFISEHGMEEHFILLGVESNPYPYIKGADIYVQTSRYEGFGLAIAEARMLNVPVVTTRFDAVYNQMIHEKNGLVVDMDADSVSDGILRMAKDEGFRKEVIRYLEREKKGNLEEIDKFYQLIDA